MRRQIRRRPSSLPGLVLPLISELEVGIPGQWEHFEQWQVKGLDRLSTRSGETQQRWWMTNGKTFCLMDLLTEMRMVIYDKAVGSYM